MIFTSCMLKRRLQDVQKSLIIIPCKETGRNENMIFTSCMFMRHLRDVFLRHRKALIMVLK